MQKSVVIAGFARSPFHFAHKGALTKVRPDDLAAQVIEALITRTGVAVEDIEDVIVGCAFPEGEQGMNMARLIAQIHACDSRRCEILFLSEQSTPKSAVVTMVLTHVMDGLH